MDKIIKPIEETVELDLNFPSVSERYFTHYYFIPKNKMLPSHDKSTNSESCLSDGIDNNENNYRGEDTCIMMHSNHICVICISHHHPIIRGNKIITKVDYNFGEVDRLKNKVSGKGKRGAQILGLFSQLCKITCTDDSTYIIYSGVRGKLLEVNERLIENPTLVTSSPMAEGYLAIALPKLNESKNLKNILLPAVEYEKIYSSIKDKK